MDTKYVNVRAFGDVRQIEVFVDSNMKMWSLREVFIAKRLGQKQRIRVKGQILETHRKNVYTVALTNEKENRQINLVDWSKL